MLALVADQHAADAEVDVRAPGRLPRAEVNGLDGAIVEDQVEAAVGRVVGWQVSDAPLEAGECDRRAAAAVLLVERVEARRVLGNDPHSVALGIEPAREQEDGVVHAA